MELYSYQVGSRTYTAYRLEDAEPNEDGDFSFFASDLGLGVDDFSMPLLLNGMMFWPVGSDVKDGNLRSVTYGTRGSDRRVTVFND